MSNENINDEFLLDPIGCGEPTPEGQTINMPEIDFRPCNLANWYWIIAGDESQLFSSLKMAFVTPGNADYRNWLNAGNTPTRIAIAVELWDIVNKPVKDVIAGLENKQSRSLRDIALGNTAIGGDGKTPQQRLQDLETEIDNLRAQLKS